MLNTERLIDKIVSWDSCYIFVYTDGFRLG
jgi:hypothetical protein